MVIVHLVSHDILSTLGKSDNVVDTVHWVHTHTHTHTHTLKTTRLNLSGHSSVKV